MHEIQPLYKNTGVKYPRTSLLLRAGLSAKAHAPRTRLIRPSGSAVACDGKPVFSAASPPPRRVTTIWSYAASLGFRRLSSQGGTRAAARLPQAV